MADGEQHEHVCDPAGILERVGAAYDRRAQLHEDPTQSAYRLFHGHGEGVTGLEIDRLGDALVLTHNQEQRELVDDILDLLAARGCSWSCAVARTRRGRDEPRVVRGQAPTEPVLVLDNGLRYEVDPLAPRNGGLYLDARPARSWIRANAAGRRVLNLFAYTGSLGMAAAAGGARGVTHVELQKRALRRLKRNHGLNDLRIDDRDLERGDLYPYLRRAARSGRTFEAIILDPPPQVPGKGPGQDYAGLVPMALEVLAPDAWLLCFFSRYGQRRAAYEEEVRRASSCPLEVRWRGTSGADFPEEDPEAKLRFTAFQRSDAQAESVT